MLPTSIDGPQASPQLLRRQDGGREQPPVGLDAWGVPALGIEPEAAVDVLLALPPECPPGVAIGDSLRFLAEVSKLGLEFVARGRLLPESGPLPRSGGSRAGGRLRWIRMTRSGSACLSTRCRPSLRAECSVTREGEPPAAIVESLLAAVVDTSARVFAAGMLKGAGRWRDGRADCRGRVARGAGGAGCRRAG